MALIAIRAFVTKPDWDAKRWECDESEEKDVVMSDCAQDENPCGFQPRTQSKAEAQQQLQPAGQPPFRKGS